MACNDVFSKLENNMVRNIEEFPFAFMYARAYTLTIQFKVFLKAESNMIWRGEKVF